MAITGSLENDAAAINALLKRTLLPPEHQAITELYTSLCSLKDLSEKESGRTPGSNFTPKPARLISILARAGAPPNAEMWGACMLVGSGVSSAITLPALLGESATLAAQVFTFLHKPDSTQDQKVIAIGLAELLDRIRHMHLSPRETLLDRELATQAIQYECMPSPLLTALRELIAAAILRFERHSCG